MKCIKILLDDEYESSNTASQKEIVTLITLGIPI